MAVKIQNENIKSSAELISGGGTAAQLPNDDKIYVTANSLNKTLKQAIIDGDLAGSGGAGSPDTIVLLDADNYTSLSSWVSGTGTIVDGSALPGGTAQGTFALSTSSPAEGTKMFQFTMNASSSGTYFLSDVKTVDPIWRGHTVGVNFPEAYDGTLGDITMMVYCNTTNTVLTTRNFYATVNTQYANNQLVFTIPATCAGIRIGFQCNASNNGKILKFDYVSVFDRPIISAAINEQTPWVAYTPAISAGLGTPTSVNFFWRRNGDSIDVKGTFTTGTVAASLATIGLPNGYVIDTTKVSIQNSSGSPGQKVGTYQAQGASLDGWLITATGTSSTLVYFGNGLTSSAMITPQNGSTVLANSTHTSVEFTLPIVGLSATVESMITPSSGCLEYSARISSAGVVTSDGPETFISSITSGGTGIYNINWVSGFFSVAPSVQVTTENGSSGRNQNTGTPTTSSVQVLLDNGGTLENAAFNLKVTRQGNDARAASRALVARPVKRITEFRYRVANATDGGDATSGSWIKYPLNLQSGGDVSFGSLASSVITFVPGTYRLLNGLATFAQTNRAQLRLRNTTAGADQNTTSGQSMVSVPAFAAAAGDAENCLAMLFGEFSITTTSTFEIQYQVQTTKTIFGLGTGANFGNTNDLGVFIFEKIA